MCLHGFNFTQMTLVKTQNVQMYRNEIPIYYKYRYTVATPTYKELIEEATRLLLADLSETIFAELIWRYIFPFCETFKLFQFTQ